MKMKVYHGNIGDSHNFVSKEYLELNGCGVSDYNSGDYTTIREQGRKDYQLIYLASGKMTSLVIDKTVELNAGDVLIHYPGDIHTYTYLEKDKYESLWIQFSGTGVEELLKDLGIFGQRLIKTSPDASLNYLFERIFWEHKLKRHAYKTIEVSLVLEILSSISRASEDYKESLSSAHSSQINAVLLDMETNLRKNYPIERYAALLNLSVSRFAHLFAKEVGISPHKYILQLKITKASQLLRQTDMAVGEVAQFVGFQDPLYFSRIYKKSTGLTPMEYKASSKSTL